MRSSVVLLVAIAFLFVQVYADCSSSGDTTVYPKYYTGSQSGGQGTYYGTYIGGGACTLDPTPIAGTNGIVATVAIADNIWAGSSACGMCLNITALGTGSGGSPLRGNYIVYVNNECPSCNSNGIDFGLNGDGVWDITWKAIPCPLGTSKIQFLLQGTNSYYIKMQARNTRYPVYGLSVLQSGAYHALVRTADNFFTAGSSVTYPLSFPLTVKVTASTGDSVIDSVPSLTNGVVMSGSTQFPDCSGGSTAATATTTATAATTTSATTAKPSTTTTTTTAATTTTTTTAKPSTTTTTAAAASTTTAKATTTTTGTSSTTGSQTSTYVYKDTVLAPFTDWSWAIHTTCDSSAKMEGACSYAFFPINFAAAYFETSLPFSSATTSAVEFYILASSAPNIQFELTRGGSPFGAVSLYGAVTANIWTKVTVPLSAFAAGTYDGFWFKDTTGLTSNSQVHLDAIRLIGV